MTNLIGHSFGRYHILEQLGEGGMATVYKAFDTRLERNVAIKVILPGKQHSEKFLKRFEREAKALAGLSHPNIVKVIDYGEQNGMPYLVMEYLPGGTLKQRLARKPMAWAEAGRLLTPIARALAYAHDSKIIHRDIKPSNILITQSGEPMLSDFGIAKMLEIEETLDLTGTGVGVGTPEYMSPEQAQGKQVDARSDIYSLGVVFYEMVTGRKPYQADTPMAVAWKLASEPLPRPKQFVKDLPDFIEGILIKTLSKLPEDRYQSMGEMASILEKVASGAEVRSSIPRAPLKGTGVLVTGLTGAAVLALLAIAFWPRLSGSSPGVPATAATRYSEVDRTYLAMEDFEDGQVQMVGFSAEPAWEIVEDGTGNEVYQVDNRVGDRYAGFTFGAKEWRDHVTEFRVKLLNDAADFGLQVRSDTITNYYVVDFSTSFLYLAYPTPKEWVRITTSYPPIQTNVWHTVRVDLQGDHIQVYVDGSRWIDERDSRYSHGEVMFFASPGTFAQVDDIKVWNEEEDSLATISSKSVSPSTTETQSFPYNNSSGTPSVFSTITVMEVYDDFENSTYNGFYDSNKWWFYPSLGVSGAQKNGVFEAVVDGKNTTSTMDFIVYGERRLNQTNAIEAKLNAERSSGENLSILIKVKPDIDYYWHYACWLLSNQNGSHAWCEVNNHSTGKEDISQRGKTIEVPKGKFIPMKIEIDPQTMVIRSYIDDELIDIYDIPEKKDKISTKFDFVVGLWVDPATSGVAQVDDVYLGRPVLPTPTP